VPNGDDRDVYLVVDDFGRPGRAWRETDVEATDLETVILNLLQGQYENPVRFVALTPPKSGRRTFRQMSPKIAPALRSPAAGRAVLSTGLRRSV
jgi:hypothetical protein